MQGMEGTEAMDIIRKELEQTGCAVVRGFCSKEEVDAMKRAAFKIVEDWEGSTTVFRTDSQQSAAQGSDDYFISSAKEVRCFWEKDAVQEKAATVEETILRINKIGHGLHLKIPVFRTYAHSEKVRNLVNALGWKKPVLPQSMYILKNPRIGGEVTAHQDSSFLFTEPRPTCLGLWLALDPATLDNGCLYYRPGSHVEPVRRHFQRRVNEKGKVVMGFAQLVNDDELSPLEGCSPHTNHDDLKTKGFVPVECNPGDLVVIHGQVEHLSLQNYSEKQRHSFQLHLIEGPEEGMTWSKLNWLQFSDDGDFPTI